MKENWIIRRIDRYWSALDRMPEREATAFMTDAREVSGTIGKHFRAMALLEWENRS